MGNKINFLKIAGILSFLTAALHIVIVFGGADWYRFFGAGEKTAILVELGSIQPTISALILALIFTGWGLYAFSGSGYLPRFPFVRTCLVLITFVYLARGAAGLVIPFLSTHPRITELSISFWVWSSLICLCFGLVHLKGIMDKWQTLSKLET
jgi:putative oxidoreductase